MTADQAAEMLKKMAFVCLGNLEKTLENPKYREVIDRQKAVDWISTLFWGAQSIRLVKKLEQENKALLHDLRLADRIDCDFCKHQNGPCTCEDCDKCSAPCPCGSCRKNSNYVWRGVCEANSK